MNNHDDILAEIKLAEDYKKQPPKPPPEPAEMPIDSDYALIKPKKAVAQDAAPATDGQDDFAIPINRPKPQNSASTPQDTQVESVDSFRPSTVAPPTTPASPPTNTPHTTQASDSEQKEVFDWLDQNPNLSIDLNDQRLIKRLSVGSTSGQTTELNLQKATKLELIMLYGAAKLTQELTASSAQANAQGQQISLSVPKSTQSLADFKTQLSSDGVHDANFDALANSWTELDLATKEIEKLYEQTLSNAASAQICSRGWRQIIWNRMNLLFNSAEVTSAQIKPGIDLAQATFADALAVLADDSLRIEQTLLKELKSTTDKKAAKQFLIQAIIKGQETLAKLIKNSLLN